MDAETLVNLVDDLIEETLLASDVEADDYLRERGLDPQVIGKRIEDAAQRAIEQQANRDKAQAAQ